MLAVREPPWPPLTDSEWLAAVVLLPPGLDRLLVREPPGVVISYVMEDLDG